jgi:uncharacterized protein (DUF697 family)
VEERPVQASEHVASLVAYLSAANERVAVDKLCEWLVGACASKSIALAAGIPACRQNVVRSLVRSCALANVGVGVVDLLPGADLPVMAASQARLAFDVAAAYDRRLSASDFGLIAGGVVLAGLGYRSVSRSVSRALPPLAWAVRGGVAFAGTVATGAVARACASGTTPQGVAEAAAGGIGKGVEELSARLSQILSPAGERGHAAPQVPATSRWAVRASEASQAGLVPQARAASWAGSRSPRATSTTSGVPSRARTGPSTCA